MFHRNSTVPLKVYTGFAVLRHSIQFTCSLCSVVLVSYLSLGLMQNIKVRLLSGMFFQDMSQNSSLLESGVRTVRTLGLFLVLLCMVCSEVNPQVN